MGSFMLAILSGGILGFMGWGYVGAYCVGVLVMMYQQEEVYEALKSR